MHDFRSEFIRFWSRTEVIYATLPVLVLCIIFSVINGEIMLAIESGDFAGHGLDPSLASKPLSKLLTEGYLGPVYQSSVIFIPLTAAFLIQKDYNLGEHESVLLNSKNLLSRKIGSVFAVVSWALSATLLAAIVNYVICFLQAGDKIRESLSIAEAFFVYCRVAVFAVLFAVLALLITALTHKLFLSVVFFLGLLFLSLTGMLQGVPLLHNLLPLIGGKSFAFWDNGEGSIPIGQSFILLTAWLIVASTLYLLVAVRKRR